MFQPPVTWHFGGSRVNFYYQTVYIVLNKSVGSRIRVSMPKRDDLEFKALHYISNTRQLGVLQSDLWRKLGASSREGSRISLKLENKGLIRRAKELRGGRWTYRLFPKRQPPSISSIEECPCLMCSDDNRCGAWGGISPNGCGRLTDWVLVLAKEEMDPAGDA